MPELVTPALQDRFQADGFAIVDDLLSAERIAALHERFEALFAGRFETGVAPDEVNWQYGTGDPSLTRQICNGWKADSLIAEVVLDQRIGEALACLGGWQGARLIQDNVLWKPPGARPLGFHRDNAYSSWFSPVDMLTCWIALDDVSAAGGTLEFVRGSHGWLDRAEPEIDFHGPADYRAPVREHQAEIVPVEVTAGGGSFHHGWTWHGSGSNQTSLHRRALVVHAAPIQARFDRENLDRGNGLLYGHYCPAGSDAMPDAHFPVLWSSA